MFDKEIIKNKLNQIVEYLDELEPIVEKMSDQEIKENYFNYHTAERILQLIVDTMIDVNMHFIKERKLFVPDDLQSTFRTLSDNKIFPADFADKIAPVVGLRNILVHRYEKIDKDLFIRNLKNNYTDFKQYIVFIRQAMDAIGE